MTDSPQLTLFEDPQDAHDPRGKVRLRLPADVHGDAVFSACRRYRTVLRRWKGDEFPSSYALFIGMNPSTAEGHVDDPTIAREWGFTVREGYAGYMKVNVGDYRATFPKDLLQPGVIATSPDNLPAILAAAEKASLVVICHGKLNKVLAAAGANMTAALQVAGVPLNCFGTNADGSPKHPLYLAKDAPLVRYSAF